MKAKMTLLVRKTIACAALALGMSLSEANGADGRALFHGLADFERGVEATDLHLPPTFSACASCHGAFGEGGREGGVIAPALGWSALTTPRGEAPAFQSEAQITEAVTKGVARGGGAMAPTMPRYRLGDEEMSALLAYLKRLGRADDYPRGVDRQTIRLATALPLSGPASDAGHAVLEGMREAFDAANRDGGLYGRRILLEAVDLAQDSDTLAKEIVMRAPFAVVGGMWRADAPVSLELARQHIAKIATLTPHKDASSFDEWDIDLLPPLDRQRDMLDNALKGCAGPGPKWAIAGALAMSPTPPEDQRWFARVSEIGDTATLAASPGCMVYGLADSAAVDAMLPATWEKRLILPFPSAIFLVGAEQRANPWRALGRASARLAVELCARAGSRLNERSPLAAISQNARIELGTGAAAHFGGGRRYAWDPDIVIIPASAQAVGRKQF